ATKRTSIGRGSRLPIRQTLRSSRTRRSFAWWSGARSPTSSRKTVPPLAASRMPGFAVTAPVKAPRSWPKSSLSRSVPENAAEVLPRERAVVDDDVRRFPPADHELAALGEGMRDDAVLAEHEQGEPAGRPRQGARPLEGDGRGVARLHGGLRRRSGRTPSRRW